MNFCSYFLPEKHHSGQLLPIGQDLLSAAAAACVHRSVAITQEVRPLFWKLLQCTKSQHQARPLLHLFSELSLTPPPPPPPPPRVLQEGRRLHYWSDLILGWLLLVVFVVMWACPSICVYSSTDVERTKISSHSGELEMCEGISNLFTNFHQPNLFKFRFYSHKDNAIVHRSVYRRDQWSLLRPINHCVPSGEWWFTFWSDRRSLSRFVRSKSQQINPN